MSLHLFSLLKSATSERHAKAIQGLADDSIRVTINHRTDYTLRATVCSGEHTYGCHLGDFGSVCDCPDFAWRNIACKHAIAVAVYALQPPSARTHVSELTTPVNETTHLQWRSGQLLCQEPHPLRVWTWPWPMGIIHHQAQWPEVSLCQTCIATYQEPSTLREAA